MRTMHTRLFAPFLLFLLLAPARNVVDAAEESGGADADAGQTDEQLEAPPSDSLLAPRTGRRLRRERPRIHVGEGAVDALTERGDRRDRDNQYRH